MATVVLHVVAVGQVMARDVFAARPAAVLAGILAPLALGLATILPVLALGLAAILRSLPHVLAAILLVLAARSEEHTSELQSLMRHSYAVFCLKKKKQQQN